MQKEMLENCRVGSLPAFFGQLSICVSVYKKVIIHILIQLQISAGMRCLYQLMLN